MVSAALVALGAAVGAPLRFVVGHHLDGHGVLSHWFPTGTFLVNVAGSFLLGLLSALAIDGSSYALLGTGFCGALTTYSAFAVKAVEHGWLRGVGYVVATLGLALAACWLGFALGS